jgi:hypothetical protein
VDDETVRQVRAELDFARRHLPGGLPRDGRTAVTER